MVIAETAQLIFEGVLPFNNRIELIMKCPTVTNFGGVTSQISCLLEVLSEPVNSRMMMSLRVPVPIGPLRVYPEQGTEWMGAVLLTSWHEDSSFGELW